MPPAMRVGPNAGGEKLMVEDLHRQRVLKFLDAFYSGDIEAALACCDEDFDSIAYAPIELFPHLGHKHGKHWVAESIRTQQKRYSSRKHEIKFLSVDGDKVATIQFLSLRKRNDDRVVHLEVAEFFTLRGGRILVHRSFFDSFDFVQQLLGQDLTGTFAASVRDAMRR
jgi:ketosteroid isomerase-like protein